MWCCVFHEAGPENGMNGVLQLGYFVSFPSRLSTALLSRSLTEPASADSQHARLRGFWGVGGHDIVEKLPKLRLLLLVSLCLPLFHHEDSPSRSPSKVEVTEKKTTVLLESGCPCSPLPSSSRKCLEN